MYSKYPGRCDGCADDVKPGVPLVDDQPPFWAQAPAVMSCATCEIELCQKCHDEKHKRNCSEPPELYSTKYYFYPDWLPNARR